MSLTYPAFQRLRRQDSGGELVGTLLGSQTLQMLPPFGDGTITSNDIYATDYKYVPMSMSQCIDEVHKKTFGQYHEGGPLQILKNTKTATVIDVNLRCHSDLIIHGYKGKLIASFASPPSPFDDDYRLPDQRPEYEGHSDAEMDTLGTSGWNKFRPGRPDVGLTAFIGELRDLPRMLKQRLSDFRGIHGKGDAYLAYQFGWAPLLRDLTKMYGLYHTIDKKISDIRKNNGKWLLRHGTIATDRKIYQWENSDPGFYPVFSGDIPQIGGFHNIGYGSLETKSWFSGRFRYYIPEKEMYTSQWRRNTIRKMYGLTLTPDMAWELIPWSWLIDYFTNAGDIFGNLSGGYVDAVAKYAYVMQTTSHNMQQLSTLITKRSGSYSGVVTRQVEVKTRRAASPFGFGMTNSPLRESQLAILAALGLTKFR